MKIFTKKSFVHKIVVSLVILISVTTITPHYSQAVSWEDAGGALLKEVMQLVASIGDAVMGALNGMMLGTQSFGSAMVTQNDPNIREPAKGSWLTNLPDGVLEEDITTVTIPAGYMDKNGIFDLGEYQIPNMLYSLDNIFANKIAALDINFLNPNTYTSAVTGEEVEYDGGEIAEDADKQISSAEILQDTISKWYKAFRNIAIVGLLIVLVYLGIRILISTTANDKAKYKENLKDWVLALCLVFVMHIIMSGIIMVTDKFTELFSTSSSIIKVVVESDNTEGAQSAQNNLEFYTNLTGLVRFKAQAQAWQEAVAYIIMYLALIIYTCMFTFMYFKRFLYTAFFTMISPLVALTYPIDKAGDRKAQAFNLWFKEYTMNVIIQPVHLLLYTALISSAMDLVSRNPLYALVAIAFLVPAEKFIKKMFGIESDTTSGVGSFAGGALAMKALDYLGKGGKKGSTGGKDSQGEKDNKPKFANNRGTLESYNENEDNTQAQRDMLDAYDENYGTQDWDAQERDAYAREAYRDEPGMTYSDEDYENILRDSGYSDEEIADMMAEERAARNQDNEQENINEGIIPQLTNNQNAQVNEENENKNKRKITGARVARLGGKALRFTGKALSHGAAMAGGAAIGLAAGLTTGDFSKTMTYMAGGAVAGNAIRNKVARAPSAVKDFAVGTKDKIRDEIDKADDKEIAEKYGYKAMREQQIARNNERARNQFLKDKVAQQKYKQMAGDIGYTGNLKDFMNAAADYREAGVEDEKLIKNALKVEMKNDNGRVGGNKHNNIVDVASFTKDYGKEYIEDDKKRSSLEGVVKSKISNPNSQKEIMETFADIHGRKEYYQQHSELGQPAQNQTRRQRAQRQQPRQTNNPS